MKKFLSVILTVILTISVCSFAVNAQSAPQTKVISETVEYFEDGSSIITTVYENVSPKARANKTVSGSKSRTAKNSSGEILWKFTVNGTFSVNSGVSATCTSSSYSAGNFSGGWELKTATASRSGNKAIAEGTLQQKILFVVTDTAQCRITLQCDANGTLS